MLVLLFGVPSLLVVATIALAYWFGGGDPPAYVHRRLEPQFLALVICGPISLTRRLWWAIPPGIGKRR